MPNLEFFGKTHDSNPPAFKKEDIRRPQSAGYQGRSVGGFFIIRYVHIGGYAWFVCGSLVVMVIALSMPFEYTCVAISGKERTPCQRQETYVPNVELNIWYIMVSKIKW